MARVHPDAELAPRDVVARGVFAEIAAGRGAFLDARDGHRRSASRNDFRRSMQAACAAGIDPARDLIPVAPAAHYHMGGIAVDATRPLLARRACGRPAKSPSTGVHGANRLASNSLLEAVVFAARVAHDIAGLAGAGSAAGAIPRLPFRRPARARDATLRNMMARDVGVIRDARWARRALARDRRRFEREARSPALRNIATAALLIAAAACQRDAKAAAAHFRSDFPSADPAQAKRTFITLGDARATRLRRPPDRAPNRRPADDRRAVARDLTA